jgi:hypothetical protein
MSAKLGGKKAMEVNNQKYSPVLLNHQIKTSDSYRTPITHKSDLLNTSKILMKKIIFTFLLICSAFGGLQSGICNLYAQPVTQEWVRHYINIGSPNVVTAMAMDSSGNVIITGYITTTNQGQNFCTVKYSSTGVQQWVAIYNGPSANSTDQAVDVGVDTQGNVYVTGISERAGLGSDDYCTIKYSPQGVQQWVRRYGPYQGVNDPYALAIDILGNVYVTGESTGIGTGQDYATIKYSPDGDSLWVKRHSSSSAYNDIATTIAVDAQANVYVGGFFQTLFKVAIIKYSTTGEQQWINANITGGGIHSKIKLDNQGNIFYAGLAYVSGQGNNYLTVKYNNNGVFQWQQTYNGSGNSDDIPYDLALDKIGNVYVTGSSFGSSSATDYTTVKYNDSGSEQWVRRYNPPGNYYDEAHSLALDDSTNVYVTGITSTGPPPNGYNQFTTIKYNSSGIQQWLTDYPGGGIKILIDSSGNFYVAGGHVSSNTGLDFCTIKYSQFVSIKQITNEIPTKYILMQNYPNPFNPSTVINYSLPRRSTVKLVLYNILGQQVKTIVNSTQEASNYVEIINLDNLPSGIYFYRLETSNFSLTRKMVLIK